MLPKFNLFLQNKICRFYWCRTISIKRNVTKCVSNSTRIQIKNPKPSRNSRKYHKTPLTRISFTFSTQISSSAILPNIKPNRSFPSHFGSYITLVLSCSYLSNARWLSVIPSTTIKSIYIE